MNKQEHINLLEMNELDFIKEITAQIRDNLDDINKLVRMAQAEKTETSLFRVTYELARLAGRHESLFNLSRQLTDDAENKLKTAIDLLHETV